MAAIRVRESVVIAVLGTGSVGRGNSRYYSEPFIFLGSSPNYGCNTPILDENYKNFTRHTITCTDIVPWPRTQTTNY